MARYHTKLVVVAACVGLVLGMAGRVLATIPDGNTIYGCYKNNTGAVRVIDPSAGDKCNGKSEAAISWAQTGQDGVPGVQGPQGPQGTTGPDGPDGVSGYVVETATGSTTYDSGYQTGKAVVDAKCPDGTAITGNGFDLSSSTKVSVFKDDGVLWVFGDPGVTVTAYTVCVDKQQFEGQ